jgi:hypothetical protein
MGKVTLEELQKRNDELTKLALSLGSETDASRIIAIAEQLKSMGEELGALGAEFEAEYSRAEELRGVLEVKLTPKQIDHVREETGETIETIIIPDPSGTVAEMMPSTTPPDIEPYAMTEGRRRKTERAAKEAMEQEIARLTAQFEGNPNLQEAMERVVADMRAKMEKKK